MYTPDRTYPCKLKLAAFNIDIELLAEVFILALKSLCSKDTFLEYFRIYNKVS